MKTREEIGMAIDAVEDALENRRIAKQPFDRGLKIAQIILLEMYNNL